MCISILMAYESLFTHSHWVFIVHIYTHRVIMIVLMIREV